MPYNNSGGPWGGGGDDKRGGERGPWGGNRPGQQPPTGVPELDRIVRKGQEQLRVLMGGRGGLTRGPVGPQGLGRGGWILAGLALLAGWLYLSFYTVRPEERAVELLFGQFHATRDPGLNFAPWPVITFEKEAVTRERVVTVGVAERGRTRMREEEGLMLTGDENIIDIDFSVVWVISDLPKFLFNLREPDITIKSVAESAMREIIGRSDLQNILARDREIVSAEVQELIQATLNAYDSGVRIVRLNFDKADPPAEVIDAFRDVQAAEQERDRFEKEAETYANQRLAAARGEAAQLVQQAEAYRAQVVNEAEGEAARFVSVYDEYIRAKDVTRRRLYIETMERVLGNIDKIIIDPSLFENGNGVLPYLPLNELRRPEAPR